jgi:hypothetical protein
MNVRSTWLNIRILTSRATRMVMLVMTGRLERLNVGTLQSDRYAIANSMCLRLASE